MGTNVEKNQNIKKEIKITSSFKLFKKVVVFPSCKKFRKVKIQGGNVLI